MTRLRPPYCPVCDRGIPNNCITPEGTHEGCGEKVIPLPRPDGGPQAFGIFAMMDGQWILQHPARGTLRDADRDLLMYTSAHAMEVRPLFDAAPAGTLEYVREAERLHDLVRQLEALLVAKEQGDVAIVDRVRLADLEADQVRLDILEREANTRAGIVLHPGAPNTNRTGLPGLAINGQGRTLRMAIDALPKGEKS